MGIIFKILQIVDTFGPVPIKRNKQSHKCLQRNYAHTLEIRYRFIRKILIYYSKQWQQVGAKDPHAYNQLLNDLDDKLNQEKFEE